MKGLINKKIKENVCAVCGNISDNGIMIKGNFICPCCEEDIVNITPDEYNYDFYVKKIKIILK